jgi:sigma-B regulation protein RsbU (phosphoserine phosphatase)
VNPRERRSPVPDDPPRAAPPVRASERDQLEALFELGRGVTSVLDLGELLPRIPALLSRLIRFDAFAVYLLDEKRRELRMAYALGYPAGSAERVRLAVGQGLVGAAIAEQRPLLVNNLSADARYVSVVPGMDADLVVPLTLKSRVIGALNIMSRDRGAFSEADVPILRQFGAHAAVALENARLFDAESRNARVFAILAEIGREMASILDLDSLLQRAAELTRRVIDYRTLGILLLDEATGELEMRLALQYGEPVRAPRVRLGEGLVGYAALHREPVLVGDVTQDSRYINLVEDVRSELVIPLLVKDRCLGVIDLESPEMEAFTSRDVEVLTVLAGQMAVAIENAGLYERVRTNEERLERELRFAQRVQQALLPKGFPARVRGVDVAARFAPARELGGDLHDFLSPDPHTLIVAVGDVSGKGVPAALYGTVVGEVVRSRTFRRRYTTHRTTPGQVLEAINTILHERKLEEYFCTLSYNAFDLKKRVLITANSGLPYPIRVRGDACEHVDLPGVPLGAFPGMTYEERSISLAPGDLFVFYTDGVVEATNANGEEFGEQRLREVVYGVRHEPAAQVADAVFQAVAAFRGEVPQPDDLTTVAVRITG